MAAEVRITISQQGAGSAAKDAAKDVKNLGDAAKDSGKGFSALKEIGIGALRELGAAATNAALGGLKALGGAVMEGISDAREAAKVNAQTEAVIKSMGNAAGVTSQHVQDFAASLSAAAGKSLFGDSQIQESSNLLLTFDKIKGETLDVATALTVDLAQALGGEPKDQAMMLGKALNDPIKGITALGRAGLTFSQEQKDVIQALVETGDVAGAQNIILAELQKQVGGSAAAAAAADGGWAQFNDRLGEAKETIGAAILPLLNTLVGFLNDSIMPAVEAAAGAFAAWLANPETQAGIQTLIGLIGQGLGMAFSFVTDTAIPALLGAWQLIQPALAVVIPIIQEIIGAFQDAGFFSLEFGEAVGTISPILGGVISFVAQILPTISALVGQVLGDIVGYFQTNGAQMMGEAQATWNSIQQTVTSIIGPLATLVNAILAQISAFWKANGDDIMATVKSVWSEINSIIRVAMQLIQATIVPILKAIAKFISDHSTEIQAILSGAWNTIKSVIDIALALIGGILRTALALVKGDWEGAWNEVKATGERIWNDIKTIIDTQINTIKTVLGGAWEEIKRVASTAWEDLKGNVSTAVEDIVNKIKELPGKVAGVGEAVMNAIWDGMKAVWSQIVDWLNEKLQWFQDQLPGSEPKDPSSPLRGLGKRGAAIMDNLREGMLSSGPLLAPQLAPPLAGAQTYNQQRSMSLTQNYYGVPYAPAMDFATANSLAGV